MATGRLVRPATERLPAAIVLVLLLFIIVTLFTSSALMDQPARPAESPGLPQERPAPFQPWI